MDLAFTLLRYAHWVGLALIVVGYTLTVTGGGVVNALMVWGARLQLLIGLALVAVFEIGKLGVLDHAWVGGKLVVALAIVALCEIARSKAAKGQNKPVLAHVAMGLTAANVVLALAV